MSTVDLFRTESTLFSFNMNMQYSKDPQDTQMTLAFWCQTKNGAPHKKGYGKLGEKCLKVALISRSPQERGIFSTHTTMSFDRTKGFCSTYFWSILHLDILREKSTN